MTPSSAPPAPEAKAVTVILVTRNQAAELRRALTALDGSRGAEREAAGLSPAATPILAMEILVVDCGSDDDIRAVEGEHPAATFLFLPGDFGATKALNIAVRSSKADFLFLLSPTVEIGADQVTALLEHLEAEADSSAVCPLLVDDAGQPLPFVLALPGRESLRSACAGGAPPFVNLDLSQSSVTVPYPGRNALLVRKQFVIGMNYFDQRFGEYWADADLAMQIRRAGRKIRLYPAIKAVWHRPAATQTNMLPNDTDHVSDCYLGAAVLLGKHEGFLSAWTFRISAALKALGSFNFGLLGALLNGKKLGSHAN